MRLSGELGLVSRTYWLNIYILAFISSVACAGTPRIAEYVVKPARSSMNATTAATRPISTYGGLL